VLTAFEGNEDGPGNAEIVMMIGTMFLTALEMLEEANLLSKDSPIQNIGFVSTLYLNFVMDTWADDLSGETLWMTPVVRYLDKHGIDVLHMDMMKAVSKEKLEELRGEIKELEQN
jgi:hypothetical protein